MKKFLLLTSFIITLFSCSDKLEFNTPAFQVDKDAVLWSATNFSAILKLDGTLEITGKLRTEIITLNLPSTSPNIYNLGKGAPSSAIYRASNSLVYSTENDGDGEIIIEEYNIEEQVIVGTFKFNALSENSDVANFTKGHFYKIPITVIEELIVTNQLEASVDNIEINVNEIASTIDEFNIIEITGASADGSFIKLVIPEETNLGSYNLNIQSVSGTYASYGFSNGTISNSQYGTLFILEHDTEINRIKGTFTYTTLQPNSVEVNNGSFTIYY